MAVINNTTSQVGDKLWIKGTIPLVGVTSFSSYTDDTEGESFDYFYEKQFRYSKNGDGFSDWASLTDENLQLIEVVNTDVLNFEYLYTHSTNLQFSGEQLLIFNSVTLDGDYSSIECGDIYKDSIFGKWFKCTDSINWCFNVSGKLFEKGIVPSYITRDENQDNTDYIAFWKTISCYFSWFVHFVRKIGEFESDLDLYKEFLKQRNVFFCEKNSDITELQALGKNYLKEIQKRGTNEVISKSITYGGTEVKGELLRLICWNNDEFLFNLNEDKNFGWNIGNSSPMWKSLYHHRTLNKAWEPDGGFTDKSKYPLIESHDITIVNNNLEISGCSSADINGIGPGWLTQTSLDVAYRQYAILIDPKVSYEISFWVKQVVALGDWFSLGVIVYDKNYNKVSVRLAGSVSSSNGYFITRESLNQLDEEYFVRAIIYNYFEDTSNTTTNLGIGQQLQFDDLDSKYIVPFILNDQSISFNASADLIIRDLQIKPTIKNYSTGFLHLSNWIDIWLQQNNGSILNKDNSNLIYFRTITDSDDPDYGKQNVLRIAGISSSKVFNWHRCMPGAKVESDIFPDGTFIKSISTYDDGNGAMGASNPGGELIAQGSYKVAFTNDFQDVNGVLSGEVGDKVYIYSDSSYPELESIMERYLLPYNVNFKNTYI